MLRPRVISSVYSSSDNRNVIGGGKSCAPGASNLSGFSPVWANRTDWQPTNLPAGYGDVGYKVAPAGYTAAP